MSRVVAVRVPSASHSPGGVGGTGVGDGGDGRGGLALVGRELAAQGLG